MAKMRLSYSDRGLQARLSKLSQENEDKVDRLIDLYAVVGQSEMKMNAPWTDRTSAARNGLFTVASRSGKVRTITFSHSVHYGIWLEVKYSGRDAIIMPTILNVGPRLMRAIAQVGM